MFFDPLNYHEIRNDFNVTLKSLMNGVKHAKTCCPRSVNLAASSINDWPGARSLIIGRRKRERRPLIIVDIEL